MGVLAPGSAHTRPSAQPPPTLLDIFGARVCRVTFKIFEKNLKIAPQGFGSEFYFFTRIFIYISSETMQKFETLGQPLIGF